MTFDRQSNGRRIEIESKSNRSRIVVVTTAFFELDGCNIDKQCELPMTLHSVADPGSGKAGGRQVAEGHEIIIIIIIYLLKTQLKLTMVM